MTAMDIIRSFLLLVLATVILMPIILVFSSVQEEPVVLTRAGVVRGMQATDGEYAMYLGIPYGVVNGSNAFGPSLPHPPFEGIFDAVHDSDPCPQNLNGMVFGTLDCLHLNVYVPRGASVARPLPVLVFVYGGHFMHGYGNHYKYGPKFLVRHGVILVTFNYRMNAYGFMCLQTPEVPGNQGLKDQLRAIRWVRDNIAAFGGDPAKITLFGQSSGAVSADLHFLYDEEGLFHQMITESGNSLCPWAVGEPDKSAALKLSRSLGLMTEDVNAAVAFLSQQHTDDVIKAIYALNIEFSPCVEENLPGVDRFISTHPVATPITKKIPIITGYTNDEALLIYNLEFRPNVDPFYNQLGRGFVFGNQTEEKERYIRHFYIGDDDFSIKTKRPITNFLSDFLFTTPTQRSVEKYLRYDLKSVYYYVFSYIGGRNIGSIEVKRNEADGAAHADELGYLFDMPEPKGKISESDRLILDRMTTMWTNFAKYGNPTPRVTPSLPTPWVPATRSKLNYMSINTTTTRGNRPFRERQAFWGYFYHTNMRYVKGYSNDTLQGCADNDCTQ